MRTLALLLGLPLAIAFFHPQPDSDIIQTVGARQLFAVRGEVVGIKKQGKGMMVATVRPDKGFAEVTVLARENDLVGSAVRRPGRIDLFGLLADDERDDEAITAAELSEGDVVSVIYDPTMENRSLEIYLH
jgi:hypothetical protein